MWNPIRALRDRRAKAVRIAEEVEALRRIGAYKGKTKEELLEEVRKRKTGREFARGVEEEARFVATRGLPGPVDVKALFLVGNRREAAKIMMQRGMSGKEIEDQFQIWARESPGKAGPPIPGYPASVPRYPPAEGKVRGFVEAGLQSTERGGLRPTMRQIRSPLYGKVPTTPAERMGRVDPEVRSAINKARLELQKRAKVIYEKEYKPRLQQFVEEAKKIDIALAENQKKLLPITRRLKDIVEESKGPAAKTEKDQGDVLGGGSLGG